MSEFIQQLKRDITLNILRDISKPIPSSSKMYPQVVTKEKPNIRLPSIKRYLGYEALVKTEFLLRLVGRVLELLNRLS